MNRMNGKAGVAAQDVAGAVSMEPMILKERVAEVLRAKFDTDLPRKPETPKTYGQVITYTHRGPISGLDVTKVEGQLVTSYQQIVKAMDEFGVDARREDFTLRVLDCGMLPEGPACRVQILWTAPESKAEYKPRLVTE